MAINIFEGARRIALLIAGLATIGTVIGLVTNEPYMPINYSIAHPTGPFVRMVDSCPSDASTHYFTAKTSTGKNVSVDLCILAMSFGKNGDRLIPYKVDEQGMIWGAAPYSSEVSAYELKLEERFKIPLGDEKQIIKDISRRYRENMMEGIGYLVAGLAIFGGVVWAIGWVVRGFLGIPHGMDRRPD
jgi:hypothetical protein